MDLFSKRDSKLSITLINEEGSLNCEMICIEGNRDDFMFLSVLFSQFASNEMDKIQISPTGAGKKHFSQDSKVGIHIELID